MTVFLNETFSGNTEKIDLVDHVGEIGAVWTLPTGYTRSPGLSAAYENCFSSTDGLNAAFASGVPATAEYDIEYGYLHQYNDRPVAGVTFRHITSENTFYTVRYNATRWQIHKAIRGTFTLLSEYSMPLGIEQIYTVKIKCRDASKKVYVDDLEIFSIADNAIADKGRIGVRFLHASHTKNRIAYIKATDAFIPSAIDCSTGTVVALGAKSRVSKIKNIVSTSSPVSISGTRASVCLGKEIQCHTSALNVSNVDTDVSLVKTIWCATKSIAAVGIKVGISTSLNINCITSPIFIAGFPAGTSQLKNIRATTESVTITGICANASHATLIKCVTSAVIASGIAAIVQIGAPRKTPATRTYRILKEVRAFDVPAENRNFVVK